MRRENQERAEICRKSVHFQALLKTRSIVTSITNTQLAEEFGTSTGGISQLIGKNAWSAMTYLKIERMLDILDKHRPGVKRAYYLFLLGLDEESVVDIAFNQDHPVNKLLDILPVLIRQLNPDGNDTKDETEALTKVILGLLQLGDVSQVGQNLDSDTMAYLLEGFMQSGKKLKNYTDKQVSTDKSQKNSKILTK